MNSIITKSIAISLTLFVSVVAAYETDTHALITKEAALRSTITEPDRLLEEWGVESKLGNNYYDFTSDSVYRRSLVYTYEGQKIGQFYNTLDSYISWIMAGSIREDDIGIENLPEYVSEKLFGVLNIETPQDDPFGDKLRVLNHFYDPYHDIPLAVSISGSPQITLGESAINWAIGTNAPFQNPPILFDPQRDNHFALANAIESMYRALAGHPSEEFTNSPLVAPEDTEVTNKEIRKRYWATTFKSLGHVAHLIQDMSQPQHTRNDRHDPLTSDSRQAYEEFVNARALGKNYSCFNWTSADRYQLRPLVFDSITGTTSINSYIELFSTSQLGDGVEFGRGPADYSNRNFFSEGTNLFNWGGNNYAFPSKHFFTEYTKVSDVENLPCMPVNAALAAHFAWQTGELPTVPITAISILNEVVDSVGTSLSNGLIAPFTLTSVNYNAMADVLIPRATSYSTELINYFFRGRLKIKNKKVNSTNTTEIHEIEVINISERSGLLQNGYFKVYYDAINGERKEATLVSGREVLSLERNAIQKLQFEMPDDIDPSSNFTFTLVYKGIIGEELGIAGLVFSLDQDLIYLNDADDNALNYAGKIYVYNTSGDLLRVEPSGQRYTVHFVVYNNDIYTGGQSGFTKNGEFFLPPYPIGSGMAQGTEGRMTANTEGLYITGVDDNGGDKETVFHFSFDGEFLNKFALPNWGGNSLGANDIGIIAGWWADGVYILDLDGNIIKNVTNDIDDNSGVVAVGAFSDRFYVMDENYGPIDGWYQNFHIYDRLGNKYKTIRLDYQASGYPHQAFDVSETALYFYSYKEKGIIMYDRTVTVDENGVTIDEEFTFNRIIPIKEFSPKFAGELHLNR